MASFRRASPPTWSTEGLKFADGFADGFADSRRAPDMLSDRGSPGTRDTESCDIPASRPHLGRGSGIAGGLDDAIYWEKQ